MIWESWEPTAGSVLLFCWKLCVYLHKCYFSLQKLSYVNHSVTYNSMNRFSVTLSYSYLWLYCKRMQCNTAELQLFGDCFPSPKWEIQTSKVICAFLIPFKDAAGIYLFFRLLQIVFTLEKAHKRHAFYSSVLQNCFKTHTMYPWM